MSDFDLIKLPTYIPDSIKLFYTAINDALNNNIESCETIVEKVIGGPDLTNWFSAYQFARQLDDDIDIEKYRKMLIKQGISSQKLYYLDIKTDITQENDVYIIRIYIEYDEMPRF